jgi:hypothetical protein
LAEILKKHAEPGSVMFSDSFSSYVNLQNAISRLTNYGYYHFWINHSHRYIHEKFSFIGTSMIDSSWRHLKKSFQMCLKRANKPEGITEFVHAFILKKIAKKGGLYFLMLKSMRHYYFSLYK